MSNAFLDILYCYPRNKLFTYLSYNYTYSLFAHMKNINKDIKFALNFIKGIDMFKS